MPSTADLEAEIERRTETLRFEQGRRDRERFVDTGRLRQYERDLEWAKQRLVDAAERDCLRALRPEGCWCLGLGGKNARFMSGSEVEMFESYCPCEDGQRSEQVAKAERRRLEKEAQDRWQEHLLEAAEIPPRFQRMTLDSYPLSAASREAFERLRYLIDGPDANEEDEDYEEQWDVWAEHKPSLLIYGPFGTGKTGLAVAALKDYITSQNDEGLFATVPVLLDTIRHSYANDAGSEDRKYLERVKSVACLVLDDLGAERVTDWVAERLFVVVNHRHDHNLKTIFTSNLSPAELGAHIGERTMWRIIEMSEVVKLDGPNLRDRKSEDG